jgi:hypothetical protein
MPPLAGVIHAAGILDDGMLVQQEWSRFRGVFAPKVAGAWNLHRRTAGLPLDFFVLFSSISSLLGNRGSQLRRQRVSRRARARAPPPGFGNRDQLGSVVGRHGR